MEKTYAILLLVVVAWTLWKGWQMWRAYQARLRVKLEPVPTGADEPRNPELPGRARVVPRVDGGGFAPGTTNPGLRMQRPVFPAVDPVADKFPPVDVIVVGAPRQPVAAASAAEPRQEPPLLVPAHSVPESAPAPVIGTMPPVPQQEAHEAFPLLTADPAPETIPDPAPEPVAAAAPELEAAPGVVPAGPPSAPPQAQQDMFAGEPLTVPAGARRDSVATRASALYETGALEPVDPLGRAASQQKVHEEVQDVIALHVVAREQDFRGEELLRCILSYGLRFGEMSIFHRHEKPTGQGLVLFSMAKAVEPGTFDLEGMTRETIPGVSFFQSLPGVNSIHAYDIMVDTAKRLATELNGDILDQQQNPLTRQLVEHYRERITEFERRRLMGRR